MQGQHSSNPTATRRPLDAVILAAGKGTRMESDLPKVVHRVADRPMVAWVVQACREAGAERCIVVIGYEADKVREALRGEPGVEFVEQHEQLGTGHAAMMARPAFPSAEARDVLVVAGDMPLLRSTTLKKLIDAHRAADAVASLATGDLADPTGYGRIIRDDAGGFQSIVEHRDATNAQRLLREVNPSLYLFRSDRLFPLLDQLETDNSQGEYYITDVLRLALEGGERVEVVKAVGPDEVEGINNKAQLQRVDAMMRDRLAGGRAAALGEAVA